MHDIINSWREYIINMPTYFLLYYTCCYIPAHYSTCKHDNLPDRASVTHPWTKMIGRLAVVVALTIALIALLRSQMQGNVEHTIVTTVTTTSHTVVYK